MKGNFKLFRIFGIDIKLHFSWFFIFALLAWSLSSGFFPLFYPDFTTAQYWIIGVISAILLFVSVLLHELSHSLIAKTRNIKVESITLFFFGGVAGITKEDFKPKDEFLMALAGPIFSLFLAGIFLIIYIFVSNVFMNAISFYLWQLNLILAIFNLMPAFPLDGGRMFRALLFGYYKDLRKATKIASNGGKLFAWILGVLGLAQLLTGSAGGLWLIFLGVFLHFIAGMSYEQVVFKEVLSKWKVSDFMKKDFMLADPDQPLGRFLSENIGSPNNAFLVGSKNEVLGLLDLKRVSNVPRIMQNKVKLKKLIIPLSNVHHLKPADNAYVAFQAFAKTGTSMLPVKENKDSKLVLGIIRKERLFQSLIWNLKYGANLPLKKLKIKAKVSKKVKKAKISKTTISKISSSKTRAKR
ncbi:MAG: site-2 protease family protein [archaeon]|nr:site-2 protease family protein [Nanoarchaeota archaeon]